MYSIDRNSNCINKLVEKKFSDLNFKERNHLQEWIAKSPDVFDGEELLIIQKEFAGFNETHERLDLLALDKDGNLVIIENKLDDSGRDVTWQAIKYASYCSTLTKDAVINVYQKHLGTSENAEDNISDFLGGQDIKDIDINTPNSLRIILVAANFRKEVTSTVLWLLNYGLKIQCFKAKPYQIGEHLFVDFEQILPAKKAKDYSIRISEDVNNLVEAADRHKKRILFWEDFITICKKNENSLCHTKPTKKNWLNKGLGMGINISCSITYTSAQVQINIGNKDKELNKKIFDILFSQREGIEKEFGEKLEWERKDDHKSSKIRFKLLEIDTYNNDKQRAIYFLITHFEKLELISNRLITELNSAL
ncbi:MAG: DUF4268 domain-containing protein [Rikenellaceae bacterium]